MIHQTSKIMQVVHLKCTVQCSVHDFCEMIFILLTQKVPSQWNLEKCQYIRFRQCCAIDTYSAHYSLLRKKSWIETSLYCDNQKYSNPLWEQYHDFLLSIGSEENAGYFTSSGTTVHCCFSSVTRHVCSQRREESEVLTPKVDWIDSKCRDLSWLPPWFHTHYSTEYGKYSWVKVVFDFFLTLFGTGMSTWALVHYGHGSGYFSRYYTGCKPTVDNFLLKTTANFSSSLSEPKSAANKFSIQFKGTHLSLFLFLV